ncbi:unnamed protein product [Gulo gulo]|uniref:Uncharacterized protein n=1 Tax=Gulo gulo TaxID=48420 RepID=A0A9X9M5N0_GULGU|nr:unnamed protein product [Gulo gulo]
MNSLMLSKAFNLFEGLPTLITFKRTFTCMSSHVVSKRRAMSKCFSTFIAFIGLLLSMSSLMYNEV